MPVIGRLDGQVEEVIIKPVGRRHAPDAPDAADAPEAATAPHAATREEPRETRRTHGHDNPPPDERRGGAELPVWLL